MLTKQLSTTDSRPVETTPLTSAVPKEDDQSSRQLPRDAAALNVFRLLGALHVTAFHYVEEDCTFCDWGTTWVSFFFMLSGFGTTHSRLSRPPPASSSAPASSSCGDLLPRMATLFRRWIGVWPAYAFAIALILLYATREPPTPPISPPLLTIELLMVQEWLPPGLWRQLLPLSTEHAEAYAHTSYNELNSEDWFISVLVFIWLMENAIFELFALAARRGRLCPALPLDGLGVALAALLLWVVLQPCVGFPPVWDRLWPSAALVDILKPMRYVHHYAAGVWLAFFLHQRTHRPPLLSGFAASTAALALLSLFLSAPLGREDITIWAKNVGVLLPLYGLLIGGMVEGDRLVCSVLDRWPLPSVSTELAYPVYIVQKPARMIAALARCGAATAGCEATTTVGAMYALTLAVLLPMSAFVAICVNKPVVTLARYLLPATMGVRTAHPSASAAAPAAALAGDKA